MRQFYLFLSQLKFEIYNLAKLGRWWITPELKILLDFNNYWPVIVGMLSQCLIIARIVLGMASNTRNIGINSHSFLLSIFQIRWVNLHLSIGGFRWKKDAKEVEAPLVILLGVKTTPYCIISNVIFCVNCLSSQRLSFIQGLPQNEFEW